MIQKSAILRHAHSSNASRPLDKVCAIELSVSRSISMRNLTLIGQHFFLAKKVTHFTTMPVKKCLVMELARMSEPKIDAVHDIVC